MSPKPNTRKGRHEDLPSWPGTPPSCPVGGSGSGASTGAGAGAGQRVLVVDTHSEQLVVTLIALVLQDCSIVLADDTVDPTTLRHIGAEFGYGEAENQA